MHKPLTILLGDCREQLRTLAAGSVQCCVTSPPYWGLRDYGVAGQLGLEGSPGEFVRAMVGVFAEVWRVLREDGTLWLNLGDSYAGASSGSAQSGLKALSDLYSPRKTPRENHAYQDGAAGYVARKQPEGLKPKDLVGIPWRVAFALQEAGWFLRSDIIWHKPNPMPESVTDRPTKAHEYLFLLTKSERYYYDQEAICEPAPGRAPGNKTHKATSAYESGDEKHRTKAGLVAYAERARARAAGVNPKQNESFSEAVSDLLKRNKRTVWTIPTVSYSEAHFATYPPALVRPCVLAGTSSFGACDRCGAAFQRMTVKGEAFLAHQRACGGDGVGEYHGASEKDFAGSGAQDAGATKARILAGLRPKETVGWEARCACVGAGRRPCVVLDPFGGSGTTGQVALEEGRHAVLCELNPAYVGLIEARCAVTLGLGL